jgi:hypothetical protein
MQILARHTLARTKSALNIAPAKNRCSVLSFFGHITHHTAALREKVSADDKLRNPVPGKTVANFYSQTAHNWNEEVAKSAGDLATDQVELITATKELKRKVFCLASLKGYSCSARRKGQRRRQRRSRKISLFGWQGQGLGHGRYWARARARVRARARARARVRARARARARVRVRVRARARARARAMARARGTGGQGQGQRQGQG